MILSFHPCIDADVQIILGSRELGVQEMDALARAAAVILPQGCSADLYWAAKALGARVFPNYDVRFTYPGKVGQSILFEKLQCPHPETIRWPSVGVFTKALSLSSEGHGEHAFVVKDDVNHEGQGVFLVKDDASLGEGLDHLRRLEKSGIRGFITQRYVPAEGNALRAVILGEKVLTYWKRPGHPGGAITSLRLGAVIDHAWRPDLQQKGTALAVAIARKIHLDLAAIDFVFPMDDPSPEPRVLEINYFFGRRGLGGTSQYYVLLYDAVREWVRSHGLDPKSLTLA